MALSLHPPVCKNTVEVSQVALVQAHCSSSITEAVPQGLETLASEHRRDILLSLRGKDDENRSSRIDQ